MLTGERTQPGIWHEQYWFARHLVAYELAGALAREHLADPGPQGASHEPHVLDAGGGEGYGAELLRSVLGAQVVSLDYDQTTLGHALRRYPGVRPVRGNAVALPLRSRSFDVVVSMQTVEHLWDQPAFARECARVLVPGGLLVVSTPNRTTFSPGSDAATRPLNPFHARELDAGDLCHLLEPLMVGMRVLGVHAGSRLRAHDTEFGGFTRAQLAGPPDTWTRELARAVRAIGTADFSVSEDSAATPLAAALDMVAVGRAPK